MKNIKETTDFIYRLSQFNKGYWFTHFKSEPDYHKVLDAYRTVSVAAKAYDVQMDVVADASENMATDLVTIYQEAASKTLDKMIDAAAYLVLKVGTDGNEVESKIRQAKYMHSDAVRVYNEACELKNN